MKTLYGIFCYLALSAALCASDSSLHPITTDLPPIRDPHDVIGNEILMLDHLIETTQESLKAQKEIKELIVQYNEIQTRYMQNTEDLLLLFQMAKQAHKILEAINKHYLTQVFDPSFLGELKVISKPAAKRGLPKP